MAVFNMVGNSGASISVKAYSSSFPPVAKEGTIGVITNAPVTQVVVSSEKPNGIEGMLWVKTGISSTTPIKISRNPETYIYPIAAWQYINETWTRLQGKCYQNGWKIWDLVIYENGTQYYSLQVPGGRTDEYEFYPGYIYGHGPNSSICTNDFFDVSNYSVAKVDIEFFDTVSSTATFNFGIYGSVPARTTFPQSYTSTGHPEGRNIFSFSLPTSGEFLIGGLSRMTNTGGAINFRIYKIWLEV